MPHFSSPTRRLFLTGVGSSAAALALPGAATARSHETRIAAYEAYAKMYAGMPNEQFPIPAVDLRRIDSVYLRYFGDYETSELPGTVIVDTARRVLFLTLPDRKAIRYGVGIGREGFAWSGRAVIHHKNVWPTWTPPAEMIERQPELEEWRDGMPPGLENPLGARALYIFQNGKDTLYRLHGTGDPSTIGKAVSSGCVRLLNQDVIDLYSRVPNGSSIVVI